MGMDVYGKQPTADAGVYFRNNIWGWRPLWRYCETKASDIIPSGNGGYSNVGWGLNAEASLALANRLQSLLDTGDVKQHEQLQALERVTLGKQSCEICAGTGFRAKPPDIGAGPHPCKLCGMTGYTAPYETNYAFTTENVEEWVAFLRDCGGFEIR